MMQTHRHAAAVPFVRSMGRIILHIVGVRCDVAGIEPHFRRTGQRHNHPSEQGPSGRESMTGQKEQDRERQSLSKSVGNILEEARMILPGTQTLFGFQLIVIFNTRFQERLSLVEQYVHLAATMLVAVATAMLIAPAAYHRRVEPEAASHRFVMLSSRLLAGSLIPLMIAVCADFYLVASLVTGQWLLSLLLALTLLGVFAGLWFVLPYGAMKTDRTDAR